ncbi:MAG: ABC transporter permease, partial [Gemmatimonadetes bacterium]
MLIVTSAPPTLHRTRRFGLVDLATVVALAGLLFGVLQLGREWSGASRPAIVIDLSPWALPRYTFYSLSRGLLAYVLSLAFTLTYGYWAAKDRIAERVLVPLLDILQSIPVLGFMPGLILALVALFPHNNIGLELAAVIMIFTGQAWNMTFSYYHSLRSVPDDLREVAAVYRFSWWQRLKWLELPYATLGLVWNSMLSMAGGWFFLMINEAFRLGDRDFRLPGIGSYMSVAVDQGRTDAMLYAIGAMTLMIVAVDQVLWRPVVVWAQKFRVEEGGTQEKMSSWFLNWLRRSRLLAVLRQLGRRVGTRLARRRAIRPGPTTQPVAARQPAAWLGVILLALLLAALAFGAWKLTHVLRRVPAVEWGTLGGAAAWTLGRVLLATALGTL